MNNTPILGSIGCNTNSKEITVNDIDIPKNIVEINNRLESMEQKQWIMLALLAVILLKG